jgi:two-component system, cell cycle sensor histidine kinase and response regulator CckA
LRLRIYMRIAPNTDQATAWNPSLDEATLQGSETILFVEDEAFVRNVTREVLSSAGYTVLTAKNASEALNAYALHSGAVDLLLTDMILPGETGRALAEKLRSRNPRLRVLFVTGYTEQMAMSGENETEFLAKPFSTTALLTKIRQVLENKQNLVGERSQLRHAAGSA